MNCLSKSSHKFAKTGVTNTDGASLPSSLQKLSAGRERHNEGKQCVELKVADIPLPFRLVMCMEL